MRGKRGGGHLAGTPSAVGSSRPQGCEFEPSGHTALLKKKKGGCVWGPSSQEHGREVSSPDVRSPWGWDRWRVGSGA